jgi:hypothetical protein
MASSSPGVLSSITPTPFRYDHPGVGRTPSFSPSHVGASLEALREIESGRVPTPAFFTVAALASALDVPLDDLVAAVTPSEGPALTA